MAVGAELDRTVRHVVAALVLVTGAGALTACGDDSGTAGPAQSTAPSLSPAGAAESRVALPFSDGFEWRIAVAPDGRTALVSHSEGFFPQTRESTIYEVTRQPDGSWADPVEVPFVDDTSADIDPFYGPDGTVWFSSIRPVDGAARTDVDVWTVQRAADGTWSEPVNPAGVNSPEDDLYPSLGPDGSLYFGSDRGDAGFDVWRAAPGPSGAWQSAEPLPAPVSTTSWEFNPAFTPDGSALVFTARDRPGGEGAGDLFLTRPEGDGWSEPEPVESVNTSGDEYHPSFSADGRSMFFVRRGDLHEVDLPAELRP
jgi:Tol biopolymer transport system component